MRGEKGQKRRKPKSGSNHESRAYAAFPGLRSDEAAWKRHGSDASAPSTPSPSNLLPWVSCVSPAGQICQRFCSPFSRTWPRAGCSPGIASLPNGSETTIASGNARCRLGRPSRLREGARKEAASSTGGDREVTCGTLGAARTRSWGRRACCRGAGRRFGSDAR